MAIILASASPRREELLRQVGCEFTIITSDVAEDNDQALPPAELAILHARTKALAVAGQVNAADVVIGADTIVVLAGQVYGKPHDRADARRMLLALAGREHQVMTGVAVVTGGHVYSDLAVTAVRMRAYTATAVDKYLATGEPLGKAGAYAIQGLGALLVEGITGCYANVVGLPLVTLDKLFCEATGAGLL